MARTKAKSLKSDKRYKDAPRYKAVYGYEDEFKDSFQPVVTSMVKEIVTTAKTMMNG